MYARSLALVVCGWLSVGCSFDEGGIGPVDAGGGGADAPVADGQIAFDARVIDADPSIDASPPMPDAAVPDAAVPDAPLPVDAPLPDAPLPDAPTTYSVVETLDVNCDGTEVTSTMTLSGAVTYRLRASGTCVVGNAAGSSVLADAEYWGFSPPFDTVGGGSIDLGVAIDDTTVDDVKPPDWGSYDSSHVYEVEFPGTGATITAKFYDPNYGNNSGSITVEILAPN